MDTTTLYMTVMLSTPDPSVQHSTDNMGPLSNPLYFKTPFIPFLAAWPITIMCLIIYSYNLVQYKHSAVTIPLIFFPLLLFSGILDNIYDFATNADIKEYKAKNLLAMVLVLTVLAVLRVVCVIYYSTWGFKIARDTNCCPKRPMTTKRTLTCTPEATQKIETWHRLPLDQLTQRSGFE